MTDTVTRKAIVASARTFIGTPWKHQGRSRKGVDCVGLVYAVAAELGILPHGLKIPPYRREPDGSVQSYFDNHMDRVNVRSLQPGMVMLHSWVRSPFHASICVDPDSGAIIHAYARRKQVVLDLFKGKKDGMKLHAVYDFRGVMHG